MVMESAKFQDGILYCFRYSVPHVAERRSFEVSLCEHTTSDLLQGLCKSKTQQQDVFAAPEREGLGRAQASLFGDLFGTLWQGFDIDGLWKWGLGRDFEPAVEELGMLWEGPVSHAGNATDGNAQATLAEIER